MCVCAHLWLHNLWVPLKDREGGTGRQSVPLQINSLIPDPFSPKHPLSPASASRSLLPLLHHSLQLLPYCFCVLPVSRLLSVNQATCVGCCAFAWEGDESVAAKVAYRSPSPPFWVWSCRLGNIAGTKRKWSSTGWEKTRTAFGPGRCEKMCPLLTSFTEWKWMAEENIVSCPISRAPGRILSAPWERTQREDMEMMRKWQREWGFVKEGTTHLHWPQRSPCICSSP